MEIFEKVVTLRVLIFAGNNYRESQKRLHSQIP